MRAILKINRQIVNDVWKLLFTVDTTKLSETDKDLIRKFGEPEINIGGTFLADTGNAYTLPAKYVKILSGLPLTQEFDSTMAPFDTATQTKVEAFQTAFITLYTGAFTTLRENTDTFTGETLVNV